MTVDDCPVQFPAPPPKLEYGALEIMEEKPPQPKRAKGSKKKAPKSVRFPDSERTESAERILEAGAGPGGKLGQLRIGHEPMLFPGWLIQLKDETLNILLNIKNVLASGMSFCEALENLLSAVDSLGLGISHSDVVEVLRRTPYAGDQWSFSHFLMGLGNPTLAREKGVFQLPLSTTEKFCREYADGDQPDKDPNSKEETPGVRTFKTQQEYAQRLFNPYDLGKEDHWPARRKTETIEDETDVTGYSMREKIFYSGLLIFEMYGTMSALEDLYFQHESIPLPKEKFLKIQARRGFGVDSIGTRKPKFAEWDRPLPPPPKQSPYLDSFPLVATRWKIQKPNIEERIRKHSQAKLQPLHLLIQAPKFDRRTVKVTENRDRIKKAMDYLASTGNCVAMLPNAHYIIHLSDTFLQKLEEINMNALVPPYPPRYNPDNDMSDILHEASKLYLPHGIPCQIARMKYFLPYHCAISLRKICEHVRKQHWQYIDQQYKEFRTAAWDLMRVGQIPCGQLRKNFVYAFDTYLPTKAWLPMGFSCTSNPWD